MFDDCLAGRFDRAAADWPASLDMFVVVHARLVVLEKFLLTLHVFSAALGQALLPAVVSG